MLLESALLLDAAAGRDDLPRAPALTFTPRTDDGVRHLAVRQHFTGPLRRDETRLRASDSGVTSALEHRASSSSDTTW